MAHRRFTRVQQVYIPERLLRNGNTQAIGRRRVRAFVAHMICSIMYSSSCFEGSRVRASMIDYSRSCSTGSPVRGAQVRLFAVVFYGFVCRGTQFMPGVRGAQVLGRLTGCARSGGGGVHLDLVRLNCNIFLPRLRFSFVRRDAIAVVYHTVVLGTQLLCARGRLEFVKAVRFMTQCFRHKLVHSRSVGSFEGRRISELVVSPWTWALEVGWIC